MKKALVLIVFLVLAISSYIYYSRPRITAPTIVQNEDVNTQNLSPKDAQNLLMKGVKDPNLVLIDVRTPEEFAGERLLNSINIDSSSPDLETKIAALDKEKVYILYCRTGVRSGDVQGKMTSVGILKTYSIEGGIEAWKIANLPTTKLASN